MTDRYYALTVTLEQDHHQDDARDLLIAIRQLRGVAKVEPLVANSVSAMAEVRAKRALAEKMWKVLEE